MQRQVIPIAAAPAPARSSSVTCPALPITRIVFNLPLRQAEIPQFRGAVAAHAGLGVELFHNHDNANGGLHYRYPLIQYHTVSGLAAITGIAEGAKALRAFAANYQGGLRLGKQFRKVGILDMDEDVCEVGCTADWQTYELHDWIALNDRHYKNWQMQETDAARQQILADAFIAQVMAFARGIDWWVENRLEARIVEMAGPQWQHRSQMKFMSFQGLIKVQAKLPSGIGIGKGSSVGFGRISLKPND